MSDALNMTLDEIVKKSKSARSAAARSGGKGFSRRGRGRGGPNGVVGAGRGAGPVRRGPLAVNARPSSSFSINKLARRKRSLPWQNQNDLLEESLRAVGVSGVEVGTTVYITNLDQGVTNEDIRELYAEIGELKRYAIHYDKNGRPSGSAEVVYMRKSDALQAMRKYNNVLLDGRPMRLEILGGSAEAAPVAARVNVTGLNGRMKRSVFIGQGVRGGRVGRGRGSGLSGRHLPIQQNQQGVVRGGRGGFRGRGRGNGGGRGNKSGRGGKKPVEKSAADLDKDLESYHAEAMNIS
ncbi:RNA recognition motif domain [Arabidopsis thaliana x Arabidopsis arenosa]|uniref:RNA recognition motif domain n=1 Tax=Arabidopsis thaliana x Arabidopsis arenosa TaxID=1240361 RepID=A0A8T2BHR7_9BRAS|nr:RNA recognition motif domain [Arabidopsis thaliana x Arabidopsis arenosa]